jgi:hypothetical protein
VKTIKKLCTPRQSVFDPSRRDTVLSLNNLAKQQVQPGAFFAESHMTQGMRVLLTEGFKRLEGRSDQGVFRLTQAMGGGKTHNLIAFGLLAQHPEHRAPVMGGFHTPAPGLGKARVITFSGRESDASYGIWGAIAQQVSRLDFFQQYYSPLSAPGETAWVNLLKGEPTVIMLDELPPYFEYARSKPIGNSDLAVVTGTALANLLVAVTEELPQCCVILTDLKASYEGGTQQLSAALRNLDQETDRVALDLEPVRLASDEFYHILRKRIFETLPSGDEVAEVAQGYVKALREARQMDVTSVSPEQFGALLEASYPFHPSIRDLYARFKENQGFQQTRGLIRLMRTVVARLWQDDGADPYLIGAQDLDLNDRDTLAEVHKINPTLGPAISHDIADNGKSVAETIDANLGAGRAAQEAARLLLVASLSTTGAIRGLGVHEVVADLAGPGRDIVRIKKDVLASLATGAWYLHTHPDGRYYFKDVENIVAKLNSRAGNYLPEQAVKEIRTRLETMFAAEDRQCYQDVYALPAVDEIQVKPERVALVIFSPHEAGLHPDLKRFWEQLTYQNRVGFLTGGHSTSTLVEAAKKLKAIHQIVHELREEHTPDSDPQMVQALELVDTLTFQFLSAVKETFTTLYFPFMGQLARADFAMQFKDNHYQGEDQVVATLKAKHKFLDQSEAAADTFRQMLEQRLFTQRVMPWTEVKKRAAMETRWPWHPPAALDALKDEMLHKGLWQDQGGYVDRQPPLPKTGIKVQQLSRDDDTGRVKLRITPLNGDTIYWDRHGVATTASQRLDGNTLESDELELSFLAVDSTNAHETGDAYTWRNTITLKSREVWKGEERWVELRAAPACEVRYTTDGTSPKLGGGAYAGEFQVREPTHLVQAYAAKGGIESEVHRLELRWDKKAGPTVDPEKPAVWQESHELTTTPYSYRFLERLQRHHGKAAEVSLSVLGQGDQWVEVNFGRALQLDAATLETTLEVLRKLVPEGEVTVSAERLAFERGQDLLDYAKDVERPLVPEKVSQG